MTALAPDFIESIWISMAMKTIQNAFMFQNWRPRTYFQIWFDSDSERHHWLKNLLQNYEY